MSYLDYSKNFKGLAELFMRDPKRYLPFVQLTETIMNAESEFTAAERELIALQVSNLNHCAYCIGSHEAVLRSFGVDEKTIASAASQPSAPPDARMAPVLAFARKLTLEQADMGQADVDSLRAAGWSDQAVEDVVGVVALFAYLNRLATALGIEGTPETYKAAGAMIAGQGYAPLVQMLAQKSKAA